jgi:hypothetical protein
VASSSPEEKAYDADPGLRPSSSSWPARRRAAPLIGPPSSSYGGTTVPVEWARAAHALPLILRSGGVVASAAAAASCCWNRAPPRPIPPTKNPSPC